MEIAVLKKRFQDYKKKKIPLLDLSGLLRIPTSNARELYEVVESLISQGILSPIKSSGTNGNQAYPLAMKYNIILGSSLNGQQESETLRQIGKLYPRLQGYLASHPEAYLKHQEEIEKLSSYLCSQVGKEAPIEVSRKERSYEIFGREKVLDDSSIKSLLKCFHLTDKDLAFYDTPEYCFHDYIPVRRKELTLLICENKDIWFNIRRCMFEDHYQCLFGVPIDGVVYGEGNRVSMSRGRKTSKEEKGSASSIQKGEEKAPSIQEENALTKQDPLQGQGALTEYVRFMGSPKVTFLYWGDIDREGFDIYRRTREVNPGLDLSLFLPGYQRMLERAAQMELEDSPSSKKEEMDFLPLLHEFPSQYQVFLKRVLRENKLIPQEIIPYTYLSEQWDPHSCLSEQWGPHSCLSEQWDPHSCFNEGTESLPGD